MIKSAEELQSRPIEINLLGSQGNAYYLLGVASNLANQLKLDKNQILKKMKEGNYENLITVFDYYFGKYVILYK